MKSVSSAGKNRRVGKLRPSQIVSLYGPGAVIDLPELSVIIAGIDHWYVSAKDRIVEPRLEAFIKSRGLYGAPRPGPGRYGGVPSFIFPMFLVCPGCRRLAPYGEFSFFERTGDFRCDSKEHSGQTRKPTAFPARFMIACARGHVDDFPWRSWAHAGSTGCTMELQLVDLGSSGSANDLVVKCGCGKSRALGSAFQGKAHSHCPGRQPWIAPGHYDEKSCPETPRTILRGASNAYFSVVTSALSIPPWSDPIHQDLGPYLEALATADTYDKLKNGVAGGFYNLDGLFAKGHTVGQIWEALSRHGEVPQESDLRDREYAALLSPEQAVEPGAEFEASTRQIPDGLERYLGNVIAVTRLREVRALRSFTRLDSIPEIGERHDVSALETQLAPIGTSEQKWRPATELRGEGVFLTVRGDALKTWEHSAALVDSAARVGPMFEHSWSNRGAVAFPGVRYVLLHSLAHVLMREMSLDAGYSSSALRERIYCSSDKDMAGLLIYTASSDSDGSLGGLVDLASPDRLGPIFRNALKNAAFCASDPLCAAGQGGAIDMNGAACHACLLVAETSCEMGNRLLDRGVLVRTIADETLAFFHVS